MLKKSAFTFLVLLVFSWAVGGCGSNSGNDGGNGGERGVKYVALGASDAVGVGATPLTNGYVFRIARMLEQQGKQVSLENLGIPGAQADLIRDTSLRLATELNPDLVTVFVGANDLIAGRSDLDFRSDLDSILSSLRNGTDALIVIANLPDISKAPRFIDDPDPDVTFERVQRFNSVIEEKAAQYSIPVAGLAAVPFDASLFNEQDGFHPGDKGHEVIADTFFQVIASRLSEL